VYPRNSGVFCCDNPFDGFCFLGIGIYCREPQKYVTNKTVSRSIFQNLFFKEHPKIKESINAN
jgi:hypothetical protein